MVCKKEVGASVKEIRIMESPGFGVVLGWVGHMGVLFKALE